jgi:SNF2 family DNA or RNA helicase
MHTVENYFGGFDILGLKDEETFNYMLTKFIHRKSKAEVLPDLPPKIYSDYPHFMPKGQQKIYDDMESELMDELQNYLNTSDDYEEIIAIPNTITKLIRLRQICLSPTLIGIKEDSGRVLALRDIIEDMKISNQQFLIYTSFRGFLDIISEVLNDVGIYHELIHGGQTTSHRMEIEQALNNGTIQAIGGMITAMGESLNLQSADTVIFTDKSWSNRANIQAENRVHRMNITNSKNIITLYTPDTVEADILKTCSDKQRIFDDTIGQINTIRELILRKGRC